MSDGPRGQLLDLVSFRARREKTSAKDEDPIDVQPVHGENTVLVLIDGEEWSLPADVAREFGRRLLRAARESMHDEDDHRVIKLMREVGMLIDACAIAQRHAVDLAALLAKDRPRIHRAAVTELCVLGRRHGFSWRDMGEWFRCSASTIRSWVVAFEGG